MKGTVPSKQYEGDQALCVDGGSRVASEDLIDRITLGYALTRDELLSLGCQPRSAVDCGSNVSLIEELIDRVVQGYALASDQLSALRCKPPQVVDYASNDSIVEELIDWVAQGYALTCEQLCCLRRKPLPADEDGELSLTRKTFDAAASKGSATQDRWLSGGCACSSSAGDRPRFRGSASGRALLFSTKTPSSAEYSPKIPLQEMGDGPSFSFGTLPSRRPLLHLRDRNVGPGEYDFRMSGFAKQTLTHTKSNPIWTFAPKKRWDSDKVVALAPRVLTTPPPAKYSTEQAVGRQVVSTRPTSAAPSFARFKGDRFGDDQVRKARPQLDQGTRLGTQGKDGAPRAEKQKARRTAAFGGLEPRLPEANAPGVAVGLQPGPGHYHVVDGFDSIKSHATHWPANPAYSFRGKPQSSARLCTVPAPGTYFL